MEARNVQCLRASCEDQQRRGRLAWYAKQTCQARKPVALSNGEATA
jgi:hypothetical protein